MAESHKAITALLEKLKQAPIPGGCKELMDAVEVELAKESFEITSEDIEAQMYLDRVIGALMGNGLRDEEAAAVIASNPDECGEHVSDCRGSVSVAECVARIESDPVTHDRWPARAATAPEPSESDVINAWYGRELQHAN